MKRYIDKLASTHLSRELLTERKTPSPLRSKSTFPESDEIFGHEIDIDGMADSKQRTLDLLDPRTKDFNRDLEFQIIARDRQIDEMNNTILMLRTLIRIKEEELKSSKVNKIANIDKANSFIDQEEKLKEELRHEKDK